MPKGAEVVERSSVKRDIERHLSHYHAGEWSAPVRDPAVLRELQLRDLERHLFELRREGWL